MSEYGDDESYAAADQLGGVAFEQEDHHQYHEHEHEHHFLPNNEVSK